MVIGTNYRILYFNHIIEELFADVALNRDVYNIGDFKKMFEGKLKSIEVHDKSYELRTEPLVESGYTQHYNTLREIQNIAHTNALTGLNNRSFFRTCLTVHLRLHGTRDAALIALSSVIKAVAGNEHLTCRIGGDEFCMFFKEITDGGMLSNNAQSIHQGFKEKLKEV